MLTLLNFERCSTRPTVVYGAITTSSWSCPHPFAPLETSTPTTLNGILPKRTDCPTGFSSPNRLATTVVPSTHTREQLRSSASVKKRPSATSQFRMAGMSEDTPEMRPIQFLSWRIICTLTFTEGDTPWTRCPSSRLTAFASSAVIVWPDPMPA